MTPHQIAIRRISRLVAVSIGSSLVVAALVNTLLPMTLAMVFTAVVLGLIAVIAINTLPKIALQLMAVSIGTGVVTAIVVNLLPPIVVGFILCAVAIGLLLKALYDIEVAKAEARQNYR